MIIKTAAEPGVLPQFILANILLETLRSDDPDGDIPRGYQGSIVYLCNRGSFVENTIVWSILQRLREQVGCENSSHVPSDSLKQNLPVNYILFS